MQKYPRLHGALLAPLFFMSNSSSAQETPAPNGYTVRVEQNDRRGTWEGWGCSLAWWAHAVGGKKHQELYADLFFSDKTVPFLEKKLPGLKLNIIRYNIGGGGRGETVDNIAERVPDILPWHRDIDGYWLNPANRDPASASWDWSRDANQRAIMHAAIARGADKVELFSNAPMWWMMDSKSSAGGHLLAQHRRDFAYYLATVTARAQREWKIKVDTVSPFNEPSAGWWNYPKNQEGCNVPRDVQKEVLIALREELNKQNLQSVGLTASDENTMTAARETHEYFKAQGIADLINKVNVHSYSGLNPWRDNKAREALRASVTGQRLWASEFGNNDGSGMVLAQTIVEDINFLRPTAWVYWQVLEPASAWGLVNGSFAKDAADPNTGAPSWGYYTHYFMAQFTRFLRPGQQVIGSSDNNSIVAYDGAKRQLIIITLNYKTAQPIVYDLSNLKSVGDSATLTTSRSDGAQLFESEPLAVKEKRLQINAAPNSISSLVVDGVAL